MSRGGLEQMIKDEWKKVVVYADRHTEIHSEECDLIMKEYIKDNKKEITHVVDLGDGIDNPFMSDFAVNPEFTLTSQESFDMYARHWKDIQDLVPKARKILIAGNHDKTRFDKIRKMNRGLASLRNIQYEQVLKEAFNHFGITDYTFANTNYVLPLTRNNKALFTHGDPRLDPNVKGGVTGQRRTAELYPFEGDIYMGHGHQHVEFPRRFAGKHLVQLGGMFDIKTMEKAYVNFHPYTNGFGVIHYNPKQDRRVWQYIPIERNKAFIDGVEYSVKEE